MDDQQIETLSFEERGGVVLKYFGKVCLVSAVLATVPLAAWHIFAGYRQSLHSVDVGKFCSVLCMECDSLPLVGVVVLAAFSFGQAFCDEAEQVWVEYAGEDRREDQGTLRFR
jgi:hypothetical protein